MTEYCTNVRGCRRETFSNVFGSSGPVGRAAFKPCGNMCDNCLTRARAPADLIRKVFVPPADPAAPGVVTGPGVSSKIMLQTVSRGSGGALLALSGRAGFATASGKTIDPSYVCSSSRVGDITSGRGGDARRDYDCGEDDAYEGGHGRGVGGFGRDEAENHGDGCEWITAASARPSGAQSKQSRRGSGSGSRGGEGDGGGGGLYFDCRHSSTHGATHTATTTTSSSSSRSRSGGGSLLPARQSSSFSGSSSSSSYQGVTSKPSSHSISSRDVPSSACSSARRQREDINGATKTRRRAEVSAAPPIVVDMCDDDDDF
jgi:hypothetical protein